MEEQVYKISKNIKIPLGAGIPGRAKYPWELLEVGDSFYVEGKTPKKLSGAMDTAAKRHNTKYTARTTSDGEGVRIWRIE